MLNAQQHTTPLLNAPPQTSLHGEEVSEAQIDRAAGSRRSWLTAFRSRGHARRVPERTGVLICMSRELNPI